MRGGRGGVYTSVIYDFGKKKGRGKGEGERRGRMEIFELDNGNKIYNF